MSKAIRSEAANENHASGDLLGSPHGYLKAHIYLGNLKTGAQKYDQATIIGQSVIKGIGEETIKLSDLSWGTRDNWRGRTPAIASANYIPFNMASTYSTQATAGPSYFTQNTTTPSYSSQDETMSLYSTIPTSSDFPPLVTATSTSGYEYTPATSAEYSETAITTVDSSYPPATSASYASAALTTTSHEDLGMVWDTEHRRNKYWDDANGMWRWA